MAEGGPPGPDASAEAQGLIIAARAGVRGALWGVISVYQPDGEQIGMLVDLVQTERAAPPPPIGALMLTRAAVSDGLVVLGGLRIWWRFAGADFSQTLAPPILPSTSHPVTSRPPSAFLVPNRGL